MAICLNECSACCTVYALTLHISTATKWYALLQIILITVVVIMIQQNSQTGLAINFVVVVFVQSSVNILYDLQ